MLTAVPSEALSALVARAVGGGGEVTVESLAGGGNNRVYAVFADGRRFVAKWYHSNSADQRDRLMAEWTFLSYARGLGIDCVPQPIASDPVDRIALYDYIDGRKVRADEVAKPAVDAAAEFFRELNQTGAHALRAALPAASEACFSIEEHLALVDRRLARLQAFATGDLGEVNLATTLARLNRVWAAVRARLAADARAAGWPLPAALPEEQRCASPSDFGFHNVLLRPNGRLCFIDFEYAGLDDPAKMVGDFFSQPAVPVPERCFEGFAQAALSVLPESARLVERARLLLPVFRVKWCCIILNIFVPDMAQRYCFANPHIDVNAEKRLRTERAGRILRSLEEFY